VRVSFPWGPDHHAAPLPCSSAWGPGTRRMSAARPAIALDRASKVFPGGTVAVREVTLDVQTGEVLVIVGTSGSGKTTTMKMINRLIEPTGGTIRVGGRGIGNGHGNRGA